MLADVGRSFQEAVLSGSLLIAIPVAATAGLVSFASPCVLPLVPGYLSFVTGLAGEDLDRRRRGRMLLGAALFVLGFTVVFTAYGLLFGSLGALLVEHQVVITRVLGVVVIVLGLAFGGWLPTLRGEWRLHRWPDLGLVGAPVVGALFALGWIPCIGPTLGAVQLLAFTEATAGRGALLSVAYCLGLGVPFLLFAVSYRRALGASAWVRRHRRVVVRAGGLLLVVLGVLLVTGWWSEVIRPLQGWVGGFQVPV